MRRAGRLVAAAIGWGLLAGFLAAPALAEELSPAGDRAMAQLASCAAGANNVLVSIVVDESGSLEKTDPLAQRVKGINSAIDVLADLRAEAGSKLKVEANLGLFAERYTPLVPWTPLDKANAARMKSVSAAELPKRKHGQYTDYRAALIGARSLLNAREAEVGGTSCKVILWFTDGALDVRGTTTSALSELCVPNGIVDSVRGDRISVIALALFHVPSNVTTAQREQLRAVAEGTARGIVCGKRPIPSDAVAGAYLRADDASALRRVFAGVGALISGDSQSLSLKCPSAGCLGGIARFPVDRGIAGFQVIVDSPDNTAKLSLAGPDGRQVRLTAASRSWPWGTLKVSARDGLTTARVAFTRISGAQVGEWTLTSRGSSGKPSPVAVDLYYHWGARLVVEAPDGLQIGQTSPVKVRVAVAGQSVPPDWYKSMEVKLRVGAGASQTLAADPGGAFLGSIRLPPGTVPSELALTASASAVSAPSGIQLAPVSWSSVLPTRLPPTYPTISPTRLVLPTITSVDGATGVLALHGAKRGTTKACLHPGTRLTGPQPAGAISVTADTQCVTVTAGATHSWTFTAAPQALADGRVTGQLQLDLTGQNAGDAVSISVPVTSSMARPVDEPLRWALVAAFLALALGIPLVLLSLGNWWIGRFRLKEMTRVAAIPVTVTPVGVEPRRDDSAGLIDPDDFHPVGAGNARLRKFSTDGVTFAHAFPWPMSDPTAYATAAPGEIVLSGTGGYTDASGSRAPVATALEQCWVLVVDPATLTDSEAQGRIVFANDQSEGVGLREIIAARSERLCGFSGWESVWSKLTAAAKHRQEAAAAQAGASASDSRTVPGTAVGPDAPVATWIAGDGAEDPSQGGPPKSTIFDDEANLPGGSPVPQGGSLRPHGDELPPPPPLSF